MDLQISWTAGWAGNHEVCYRKQGTVAYTCQTVVATLGPNSVLITVPNNFCDDVTYEGYILAECQGAVEPSEGTQFSILINTKTDPCEPYQIDCDNSPINALGATGGSLYQIGDAIMADAVQVGDVNTIDGGGAILTVNFTDPVTPFSAPPVMTIVSGAGAGAVITAPLTGCIPILLSCDGAVDNGVPAPSGIRPNIPVGSSFYLCAEVAPTPSPDSQYTVTNLLGPGYETCHCEGCVEIEVSNPTGGNLYLYYTTEDPVLGTIVVWQETIAAGASNVNIANQALEDSVSWDAGLVVVTTPCPLPA
jgi:hypothetical protein